MLKSKVKATKQKKAAKEVEEKPQKEEPAVVVKDPFGFEIKMANKWYNKQRTLLLCTRGVNALHRHLYIDIFNLMPHGKKEAKVEKKDMASQISDLTALTNCNNFIFFETRKKKDLYMWMGKDPNGPTVKFLVENITTTEELRMTGNNLKGSRPLLSFDQSFESTMHYKLIKQLLIETVGTPNHHPKSKPFFDHMFSFTVADNKVWFRHYQLSYPVEEKDVTNVELIEIGPRFSLNIIKIFEGTMSGLVLYENQLYESPNTARRALKLAKMDERSKKVGAKRKRKEQLKNLSYPTDEIDNIYEDGFDLNGNEDMDDMADDDDDEEDF